MRCWSRESQHESAHFISLMAVQLLLILSDPDPELQLGAGNVPKEQKVRIGHKIRAGAVSSGLGPKTGPGIFQLVQPTQIM